LVLDEPGVDGVAAKVGHPEEEFGVVVTRVLVDVTEGGLDGPVNYLFGFVGHRLPQFRTVELLGGEDGVPAFLLLAS
jgi:hypothetical protein